MGICEFAVRLDCDLIVSIALIIRKRLNFDGFIPLKCISEI